MKVGLIARGEDRGLGNLTWEWQRHMHPDRTLLVVPDGVAKAGLVTHVERYPGATPARFNQDRPGSQGSGMLDERTCREWLDGLDVVFSAETFYDWRFCRWAREAHVATVCLAMPEFVRPDWFDQPTQWWAPTTYRLIRLPSTTRVVPVPVPTDRFTIHESSTDGPLRWLHVAGAQTISDRNGTRAVMSALHAVQRPTRITVRTQTPLELGSVMPRVQLLQRFDNVRDYWRIYDDADVLVMPRRYAGLCLPTIEAMGAGLPVVMTDMAPQNVDWPVALTRTYAGAPLRMMGGQVETGDADAVALAELMDTWDEDRSIVGYARARAIAWAADHSWEAMRPRIVAELEHAASLVT